MDVAAILAKSADWLTERRKGIGGSDAAKIMSGEWLDLWEQKTGRVEGEDLSRILAVQMGTFTEPLNRYWFAQETGVMVAIHLTPIVHASLPFMRCQLDGSVHANTVWEAKHVSAFTKDDEVVARYFWQLQHQMACTGWEAAFLSVFFGNAKWAYFTVTRDNEAIAQLEARCAEFWRYVQRDEMPPSVESAAPIEINFDQMREVDMTGRNEWAALAADWIANKDAAKAFDVAAKGIKELVEADVKKASGHGITVTRSKAGALSIKGK